MVFENGVKNIQARAYNGAPAVIKKNLIVLGVVDMCQLLLKERKLYSRKYYHVHHVGIIVC